MLIHILLKIELSAVAAFEPIKRLDVFVKNLQIRYAVDAVVASYELGIFGECDVVEFIPSESGALLYDKPGKYTIIPVEYKHGEPKVSDADILQVAAQALCLEDMFCTSINELHIFYGKTKRRQRIELTDDIRNRLKSVVEEMHELYIRKYTPKVKQNKNCRACSLKDLCLPKITKIKTVKRYISDMTNED